MPASCLDLQLEIDSDGRLRTKCYDKEDDFNFFHWHCELYIYIFVFICSNIQAPPEYGDYISQSKRYILFLVPFVISVIEGYF
jgi:hypothetical protein